MKKKRILTIAGIAAFFVAVIIVIIVLLNVGEQVVIPQKPV